MVVVVPATLIYPFILSFVFLLVLTRIFHAVLCLFTRSKTQEHSRAEQVLSSCIHLWMYVISQTVICLLRFLSYMSSLFLWFLILALFLGFFYVMYEEYPKVFLDMVTYYNTRVGPFMHTYFVIPMQLINMFYIATIPIVNGIIWFFKVLFMKGFLPIVLQNLQAFVRIGVVMMNLMKHLAFSMKDWAVKLDCSYDLHCLNPRDKLEFDMLTPLQDVRDLAIMGISLWKNVCTPMQIPAQLVLYPLLDTYFSSAVHHFVNSLMQLYIQIPVTTYYRCKNIVISNNYILMCTPDFEPFWTHVFTGLKATGTMLDHWMRYALWLVEQGITNTANVMTGTCEDKFLPVFGLRTSTDTLLKGNTAVIGIGSGSTSWMAVGNGSIVMFQPMSGSKSQVVFKTWPLVVDPTFGFANVRFSKTDKVANTIMGCNCSDVASGGVAIQCGFVSLSDDIYSDFSIAATVLQDNTWKEAFTCNTIEISLKSVRFPVRRYDNEYDVVNDPVSSNCVLRGNCESVDATIWLVPKCGVLPLAACNPLAIGTSCYPFCMATRMTGSQNAQLVFVNAQNWRTGKQLLYQNCIGDVTGLTGATSPPDTLSYEVTDNAFAKSIIAARTAIYYRGLNVNPNCVRNSNSVSFLNNTTPSSPYIRSAEQPFAITGDTILIFSETPDGAGVVHVERLTGDQQDVFTLVKASFVLEAAPRMNLPVQDFKYNPLQHVYVPLEFQARRIYATSSEKYVFYALSPNLELFGAYFDYCRNTDNLNKFQFMLFSSYSPLRIYRVRAYCAKNCIGISASYTFDSFANAKIDDSAFNCSKTFNASIKNIEYMDSNNLAVTVQEADATYDAYTDSGLNSQYKIYWMHPETMQVRSPTQGPWTSLNQLANQDFLGCIDIPPSPALGTFLSLTIQMPLHLVRFGLNTIMYTPGVIQQWRVMGSLCPVETLGHSIVSTCTSTVYALDDYFDSLEEGASIVWGSVVYVSDLIGSLRQDKNAEPTSIQKVLQGLAAYGQATKSLAQLQGSVVGLLNTPITKELEGFWMIIRTQSFVSGASGAMAGVSAWARYGYLVMHNICISMIKELVLSPSLTSSRAWTIFSSGVYETQGMFQQVVGQRARAGCTGLRIVFGGDNPWANLMYHICLSNQKLSESFLTMFGTMFVEVPLVKCACTDSSSFEPVSHMISQCIPGSPLSIQPLLIHVLNTHSQDTCAGVIDILSQSMTDMFTPWFSELFHALDALGESIDYSMIAFDKTAGQCTNFQTNPNVVVIIPEPVDYFQACGTTQLCKTKCSGPWSMFQEALNGYSADQIQSQITITHTMESLFFPYPVDEIVTLGTVIALTQVYPCTDICTDVTDQCVSVAFLQESRGDILIRYFCIPNNPVSPVRFSEASNTHWDVVHTSIMEPLVQASRALVTDRLTIQKGYFLQQDGSELAMSVMVNSISFLLQLTRSAESPGVLLFDTLNELSTQLVPLIVQGMSVVQLSDFFVFSDKLVLSLGVRVIVNGNHEAQQVCLFLDSSSKKSSLCSLHENLWRGFAISEFRQSNPQTSVILLWPTPSLTSFSVSTYPRVMTLVWTDNSNGLKVMNMQDLPSQESLLSQLSLTPQSLIMSKYAMDNIQDSMWVIYTSKADSIYDWLQQMRVVYHGAGADASVLASASFYNSQRIKSTITVVTQCDGSDCRGCPNLQLQGLCNAYQSCAVFQCVGTPINLNRPLCGLGLALKSFGSMTIQSTQGAYSIFVQMFMTIVKLSSKRGATGTLTEIAWPDEKFFSYVCTAKDSTAELVSVITSSMNSAIQLAQTGGPILERASKIDPSAHIALSMSITALTSFFHQLLLYPIYTLTIGRTILVCNIQGIIALFTVSKSKTYSVNIVPARFANATASMVGHCLTQGMMTRSLQTGDSRIRGALGNAVGEGFTNAIQTAARMQIEPAMHLYDGMLAYLGGAVYKFGEVLKGFNVKDCLLPNVLVKEMISCACGDTPARISYEQAFDTVKAHWCTGTLFLTKADGSQQAVYNPYSFSTLQSKITPVRYAAYFTCLNTSLQCEAPNDDVISQQGFNLIQVMTKCRRNFAQKQWDPAAFIMYDKKKMTQYLQGIPMSTMPDALNTDAIGQCLLQAAEAGKTNEACLSMYMQAGNLNDKYWSYTPVQGIVDNLFIDGCIVFSGPAAQEDPQFQSCISSAADGGAQCQISPYLWSPASGNQVPVAFSHVVNINETGRDKTMWVEDRYNVARSLVMPLLEALQNFSDTTLEVGFFSAEGDLIHQMLDCVYLGPYARMDYWPMSYCGKDENNCLHGPSWSRDADGTGQRRGVDPRTCPKTKTLPFTCGSPSRKAVIKHFVDIILLRGRQGSALMNKFIRQWVKNLMGQWHDSTAYGVEVDPGTYLPVNMISDSYMYLNTSNVLTQLETDVEALWQGSLFTNDPWINFLDIVAPTEKEKYLWKTLHADVVKDEARYDTTQASMMYNEEEAMHPPTQKYDTSLWEQCHGALQQVFFTMPVHPDTGLLYNEQSETKTMPVFRGGGPEQIQAYVKQITQMAFKKSPLFRHYHPKHKPSWSRMCVNATSIPSRKPASTSFVSFTDFSLHQTLLMSGNVIKPVPYLGAYYGTLGDSEQQCFCGWDMDVHGMCTAPAGACSDLTLANYPCTFSAVLQNITFLKEKYKATTWDCPLYSLSEHFGFLDRDASEAWLQDGTTVLQTSTDTLLRFGPGGVRVGNLEQVHTVDTSGTTTTTTSTPLSTTWKNTVFPSSQVVDPMLGRVHGCMPEDNEMNMSLLDDFVDNLFPMAQGIAQPTVHAYCLRYAMEVSKNIALQMGLEQGMDHLMLLLTEQKAVVSLWQRRCGSQVQVISLCQSLSMYQGNPLSLQSCARPWVITGDTDHAGKSYITPQCLVAYFGKFYDPCICNHMLCDGTTTVTHSIDVAWLVQSCAHTVLDPQTIVATEEMGWWEESTQLGKARNTWLKDFSNLLQKDMFMQEATITNNVHVNTNTGSHWASASGPMADNSVFCDMISDYWPEDEGYFPTGYHVSLPCMQEESGYRGFDNVFVLDEETDPQQAIFRYMEDQSRDADVIDSHFGAGGLCRTSTFGFPMYETNTMRICTQSALSETADVHVPGTNLDKDTNYGNYACSTSSSDIPWSSAFSGDAAYYDSTLFSVGTVPNLPTEESSAQDKVYPSTGHFFVPGNIRELDQEGWGSDCDDFTLPLCISDGDCPDDFKCVEQQICVSKAVECTQHKDCPDSMMCTGTGKCAAPKLSIWNDMNETVEFRVHSADCGSESNYSMVGASHWAYVPDLLEAHGMCSYRHWREYLYTLTSTTGKCTCQNNTWDQDKSCTMQADTCPYYNFMLEDNPVQWWVPGADSPSRLKMMPTTCDRDYERMQLENKELRVCVPSATGGKVKFVANDGKISNQVQRAQYVRTYDAAQKKVAVRNMPYKENKASGFLGSATDIRTCGSIVQCYADDFYVNGVLKMKLNSDNIRVPQRTLLSGAAYAGEDIFRCGVIGYWSSSDNMCKLDTKLFPLYQLLCKQNNFPTQCAYAIDIVSLSSACSRVKTSYSPSMENIADVNVRALIDIFHVFIRVTTLTEHLAVTQCMTYVFDQMQSTSNFYGQNLYYPTSFTVYEFPVSWMYQCMVGAQRIVPDMDSDKRLYDCPFFSGRLQNALNYNVLSSADSFEVYTSRVTGGYTSNAVYQYIHTHVTAAKTRWQNSVSSVRAKYFSMRAPVSTCYSERWWNLQEADVYAKALIYVKTQNVCDIGYVKRIIKFYNDNHPLRLINTTDDIDTQLTNLQNRISQYPQSVIDDLLQVIEEWGLDFIQKETGEYTIDSQKGDIDKYVQKINNAMQGKYPVQYFINIPEATDNLIQSGLVAQIRSDEQYIPYYEDVIKKITGADCDNAVSLFPSSADVVLKQVKICPVYDTGFYQCGFPSFTNNENVLFKYDYLDVQNNMDITAYITEIYRLVRAEYQNQMPVVSSLPLSSLNFFAQETAVYNTSVFQFNVTLVKKYLSNINPDTSVPLMCVLSKNSTDFTLCTNPHYIALQEHVQKHYVQQGPLTIEAYHQAHWDISSSVYKQGSLYSFASTSRRQDRQNLMNWLNNETVCDGNNLKISDRMCLYSGSSGTTGALRSFQPLSPWTIGNWNPGEKCDVQQTDILSGYREVIDVYCYQKTVCPFTADKQPDFTKDYYQDMPFFDDGTGKSCKYKQNQQASYMNVRDDVPYNLCRGNKFSDDDICVHNQGMLGGSDGKPTQDTASLYQLFNLSDLPEGYKEGYLLNQLFRGSDKVNYGFFIMKNTHLGGHHVAMRIQRNQTIGSMTIFKMPLRELSESSNNMDMWVSVPVSSWVSGLQAAWKKDHEAYLKFAQEKLISGSQVGWDCPMKRRAFYAGMASTFKPSLPSARRSKRLFENTMTGEYAFAHPTQKRMDASAHIGPYITSNGFCYCPVTEDVPDRVCSLSFLEEHNCSLKNTIESLKGSKWMWSHTFLPRTKRNEYKQCTIQFDWPFVRGALRDDDEIHSEDLDQILWKKGSDPDLKRCHLLDRTPAYQYMYVASNQMQMKSFTTLDKGVCHTGRLQSILPFSKISTRRCVRLHKDITESVIQCQNYVRNDLSSQSGTIFQVSRRQSITPRASANNVHSKKRHFCNKCSALPRFETRQGQGIKSESSFGVPYRRSATLAMAQDLKQALCENSSMCINMLNQSAWTQEEFMKIFLKNPHMLFLNSSIYFTPSTEFKDKRKPDTTSLWNQSWVYCPTPQALATGQGCQGSIPESEWRVDRVGTCYSTIRHALQGQPDPMARTSFCDISKPLTELCVAIEKAKKIIQSANCIQSNDPKCARQEYIYTPGVWDVSNQAFVHQTVREFYMLSNQSVCPIEYDLQNLIDQNGQTLLHCPATPLFAAYELINSLRYLAFQVCDILIQLLGVFSNLFLTLLGGEGNTEFYQTQFIATAQELQRSYNSLAGSVSNVIMDQVMFTGFIGIYIQKTIKGTCDLVNQIFLYLHNVWCKVMVVYLPAAIEALINMNQYVDDGLTVLNDFMEVILKNYLPEAMIGMVAKGYHMGYQSRMAAQRQQAYESAAKIQLDEKKPVQATTLDTDQRNTAANNKQSKTSVTNLAQDAHDTKIKQSTSARVMNTAGKVAGFLDVAAVGYGLYQDFQMAQNIKNALERAPDFWTIFDFQHVVQVLNAFYDFLLEDVFCYQRNTTDVFLPCHWIRLPNPNISTLGQRISFATKCWADAQVQDVGTTTLYACTGTSICCTDVYCSQKTVCIQCPQSQDLLLINTFGCNTMTQQCQCGIPKMRTTKCMRHSDCILPEATCSLLTSLDDVSYGSVGCTTCTAEPVCLILSTSQVGQCTCMTSAQEEVALCTASFGQSVFARPNALCGYDYASEVSDTLLPQYYWNNIALIQCANSKSPTCVEIVTDTSYTFYMVMSNHMQDVILQTADVSRSRRRALLSVRDDPKLIIMRSVRVDYRHAVPRNRKVLNYIQEANARIDQSSFLANFQPTIVISQWVDANAADISWFKTDSLWTMPKWSQTCAPVYVTYMAGQEVVVTWTIFYTVFDQMHGVSPGNFSDNILSAVPQLYYKERTNTASGLPEEEYKSNSWTSIFVHKTLQLFSIRMHDIQMFFRDPCNGGTCIDIHQLTWTKVIDTMLECDLDSVMFCSSQKYNLFPSTVFIIFVYIVLHIVTNNLGIGFIASLYFYFIPILIIYHTFSIAPGCFPMLPTCLVDQYIHTFEKNVPLNISFPKVLQCGDQCLRSCSEFGFRSYQDPLVFFLCDLDFCDYIDTYVDTTHMKMLVQEKDNIDGYRLCAFVSSVMSLPVLAAAAGIVFLVLSLCISILSVVPQFILVLWHIVIFNHHSPTEM